MNFTVTFTDGGQHLALGVREIAIRDGQLWLDSRSVDLSRVLSLSSGAPKHGSAVLPKSSPLKEKESSGGY